MTAPTRSSVLPAGRWSVLPSATQACFRVRDVLHRPVTGRLDVVRGHVDVDGAGVPVAVVAELDLASVDTGHLRRDRDLRGRRFFDVERSALLVFTAGTASAGPDGAWSLPGALRWGGSSCPVDLDVEVVGDEGPGGAGPRRVRATTVVDRMVLGLRAPRVLVGRQVQVTVEAELAPPPTA